jgi:succinyl-CoA synthetase alpha subunit
MVAVLRNAGFSVASSFGDGVIEVRLDLRPTPEAEAAISARAQQAEGEAVRRLLAPRSVAVIGASRERSGVGNAVLRNLLEHEFAGPVYAVNPAADSVADVRALPEIGDIAGPVDLAMVVVPASQVPAVVEDCGRKGVPAVIVISAGFAEAGPEGAALSAAVLRAARRFGTRLLGPNCPGVINTDPKVRLHATFATPNPGSGPVALLSESGTIGGVILDRIGQAGLGASSFAAIGNRADVSANDMLRYWGDDPRTELVLLYLESFGNARKFSRIARELGRAKPIVAVKSRGAAHAYPADGGPETEPMGEGGAPAARSEAARAGSMPRRDAAHPAAVEALLEQTGVVRVVGGSGGASAPHTPRQRGERARDETLSAVLGGDRVCARRGCCAGSASCRP